MAGSYNYSNCIFKYANRNYTFVATLLTSTNSENTDLNVSLDTKDIEDFTFENKFNDLVLNGYLVFTDRYAAVDKFLNQQYGYCEIMFAENVKKTADGVTKETIDQDNSFKHIFIITNIKIIGRQLGIIKYRIDLVSNNWFKCIANIKYTNYNKPDKVPLFDILKACIAYNGMTVGKSFQTIKSDVKIEYMTQPNDNLFTVARYLMQRQYFYTDKDEALKFFLYNPFEDKYDLFDASDRTTCNGVYTTCLSFFKSNIEGLIQQDPTNFGTLKNAMSKTQQYKSMFDHNTFDYSFAKNAFENVQTKQETFVNMLNERMSNDTYTNKYVKMFDSSLKYENYSTYWDNSDNMYDNAVGIFEENNSLVADVSGEIARKPGSILNIAIDRSIKNITNDNIRDLQKLKMKYKAFEGPWITSKVVFKVSPANQKFRQQLILFKNYVT